MYKRQVFDESAELAAKLAEEEGLTYIHPFNDLEVATGQGTIAYEIFQDLPDVDIILVPIGGGGLAAGVSTLAKLLNPNVKVIGVEPEGAACMKASLEAGHVVSLPTANTIADGTAVKTPGDKEMCIRDRGRGEQPCRSSPDSQFHLMSFSALFISLRPHRRRYLLILPSRQKRSGSASPRLTARQYWSWPSSMTKLSRWWGKSWPPFLPSTPCSWMTKTIRTLSTP